MAEIQTSALRVERPREMVHDHVVRLGRAAGPDDVRRLAAEKVRELFARFPERGVGAPADLMRAGRVAADCVSVASSQASRASRITGAVALWSK